MWCGGSDAAVALSLKFFFGTRLVSRGALKFFGNEIKYLMKGEERVWDV